MMQSITISTARLILEPLNRAQLENFLAQKDIFDGRVRPAPRTLLTLKLSKQTRKAIGMKLKKMARALVEDSPWITYWMIRIKPEGTAAGMIGFKGAPDLKGEVEIGYGIHPDFQSKGYMTEAVRGLSCWAFNDPRCRRIVAPQTKRSNPASNRVLQKAGFSMYEETKDSISWCLEKDDFDWQ